MGCMVIQSRAASRRCLSHPLSLGINGLFSSYWWALREFLFGNVASDFLCIWLVFPSTVLLVAEPFVMTEGQNNAPIV